MFVLQRLEASRFVLTPSMYRSSETGQDALLEFFWGGNVPCHPEKGLSNLNLFDPELVTCLDLPRLSNNLYRSGVP